MTTGLATLTDSCPQGKVQETTRVKRRWYVMFASKWDWSLGLAVRIGRTLAYHSLSEWQIELFVPGAMLGMAFGYADREVREEVAA